MATHPTGSTSGESTPLTQSRKTRKVIQEIFASDTPEAVVNGLPVQTLYLAVARQGLLSCGELIEITPISKVRLLLDLDCWSGDTFNEDAFWSWLELPDSDQTGLDLLKKILHAVDLKLIALLISRHCNIWTSEEPTDEPPNSGYFTPDKGSTWINISHSDEHRRFLLGRFLAFIFESNTELFYQLISIPHVATDSELEETAYQDKSKRLEADGFPSESYAAELHAAADPAQVAERLKRGDAEPHINPADIQIVRPFTHDSILPPLLRALVEELSELESFEADLTLIMNAALVRFRVDMSNDEGASELLSKVRGAINLGLDEAMRLRRGLSLSQTYSALGLKLIYRLGLGKLYDIRLRARKITDAQLEALSITDDALEQSALLALFSCLREPFPHLPRFFKADGTLSEADGKLEEGKRAFETHDDLVAAERIFEKLP